MAPSAQVQRAQAAVKAMKLIGFDPGLAKVVLKKLLKVYENNWEYIEAENYRLLADSILDDQESKDPEAKENDDAVSDEPELSRKRLRRQQEELQLSSLIIKPDDSGETSVKRAKMEESVDGSLRNRRGKAVRHVEAQCSYEEENACLSPRLLLGNGTTKATGILEPGPLLIHDRDRDRRHVHERLGSLVCYKEPKIEPDTDVPSENVVGSSIPDNVPCNEPENSYVPLAIMSSDGVPSRLAGPCSANQDKEQKGEFMGRNASTGSVGGCSIQEAHKNHNGVERLQASMQKELMSELPSVQERCSATIDIASSTMGEVKLTLKCISDCPEFRMPTLETLFTVVEDRCLKSCKIQPKFSLMNLMKEICQCAVDIAAEAVKDAQRDKETHAGSLNHDGMATISFSSSLNMDAMETSMVNMDGTQSSQKIDECNKTVNESSFQESCINTSRSLVPIPQQDLAVVAPRPPHDENDIAKGEERVRISLINEFTNEKYPPYFHYIPQNVVYQNAYVNFSLARIGDVDCCQDCFGDCLSTPIPCACTRETGGEFVYTRDGILKKEFLNECISMNRYPDKHHHFYCKDCPIEKSKNEKNPESCKGHLVRKFIKECWSKCGCSKQCGNRVVQRSITRNLQVFYTAEGKGWGLRTLEELPRGAFICEYIGEILTNTELYDRTIQKTGSAKHSYPVLLDADWGSEASLRDEEALCLDATFYGNIGRFVNHRCLDANLVEVPVEWETPDHHYYHLAFFTTRKIEALEELTWDYGIDFDDCTHPVKAFKCLCASRYCRDRKRSKARSRAST
ncbi:Histone-lysine N-methyltransferase SUVR2 [Apostasia shenzhenica]|uniref:Histone-lysine N-methyltransferase SUVR2 n=1 Tax=Apostasia shenzhenica TaxID=1088818 RepID=A0A2I0AV57_9ASPA|nr:Histone-lysine N-methyltransferase SUVR2 [Apostasia shenzhenica]